MNNLITYPKIGALIICFLFVFGCSSTPKTENQNISQQPTTNFVSYANSQTNIVMDTNSPGVGCETTAFNITHPTNSVITSHQKNDITDTPQKDKPRPWDIELYPDSKFAQIDNTKVFLYEFPKQNKNGLFPHFFDQTKIVDVIFSAHNNPIITNRPCRVFIDPGHGGEDPGAISTDQRTYEKKLTLDIAERLQTYLHGAGFSTMLSRTDNNTTIPLDERTFMANSWGADIFISIHINSSSSKMPNGYETYILANVGQPSTLMNKSKLTNTDLAFINATYMGNKNDNQNLLLGFAIHRRTAKTTRIPDRGLRRARFKVLRHVAMPAVLVECGYLSSQKDSKLLNTADFRERCARGIYQGICDYVYGRMQPGLASTPVPKSKKSSYNTQSQTPDTHNDVNKTDSNIQTTTPQTTQKEFIHPVKYKPMLQPPVWTPSYEEDEEPASPELKAIRQKALTDAGINFSPKENNTPTQNNR